MKTTVAFIIAIVIIIAGLFYFQSKQAVAPTETGPGEQTSQQPQAKEKVITLNSQNNSGESGTATLTEADGRVKVVLALGGAPVGILQPAHIHTGTCANLGGVKFPLENVLDGKSETLVGASFDALFSSEALAINVHKSQQEANIYVACGDLGSQSESESGVNISGDVSVGIDVGINGAVIEAVSSGFSPSSLKVKAGSKVTFKNMSDVAIWPASAQHPTHTVYPGSGITKCGTPAAVNIFDACRGIKKGESWSFTFNAKGEWKYHNHNNPAHFGAITVE